MTDIRYDLIITGQLLPNVEKAAAIAQLARRLKIDPSQAEKLFSGNAQRIKKAADEELARKFIKAFQQAGVELVAKRSTTPPAKSSDPDQGTSSSLSFTEQGADLLRVDEKRHFEQLDLAGEFELAEVGAEIESLSVDKTPITPNIDYLAVAEVGEPIPTLSKPPAQALPDISHLSIEQ